MNNRETPAYRKLEPDPGGDFAWSGAQTLIAGPGERDGGAVDQLQQNNAQKPGASGNNGASAIPIQTKTSVTARVPNRSIRTPIWIDRNKARNDRAPTRMPISAASSPSDRP